MIPAEKIKAALCAWPYQPESVTPMTGQGMNSATWLVVTAHGHYVAKLVDDLDAPGLIKSLRIAEFLAARELPCGPPVRTRGGELVVPLPEGTLALLRQDRGTPPDPSVPSQVRRAGRVLARAHNALRDFETGPDPHYRWPWEWVDRLLNTIAMPQHVNVAARHVWLEIVRTVADHQLSVSVIHGDPGLSGFLLADDNRDALIDWTTTMRGPLLYDLACVAVMTKRSGPQVARWFTEGYAEQIPEIRPELAYLDYLVKARWIANAIYFASRIERGIQRGSDSPTANQAGLEEAYAGMTGGANRSRNGGNHWDRLELL